MADKPSPLSLHITLGVGLAGLVGGGIVALTTRAPLPSLILVAIGASALSGYLKAKRATRT